MSNTEFSVVYTIENKAYQKKTVKTIKTLSTVHCDCKEKNMWSLALRVLVFASFKFTTLEWEIVIYGAHLFGSIYIFCP